MINKKFLDHHYYTDVITFDYNKDKVVSGDIFVSIDQVKLNAVNYNCLFELELSRVVIHGVLHLLGFNDSSDLEKEEISRREDEALEMLKTLV